MRTGSTWLFLALSFVFVARGADETPLQTAQKLFDAMKAHDSGAAAALFLPGATLASVDAAGQASVTPAEQFVKHIGTGKGDWVERMRNPKMLEQGPIAVVWGEYDFHLNGKFTHCGIDSFSMLKTIAGWKIASVTDTRQTTGCQSESPSAP
jgi:hypothetical protein